MKINFLIADEIRPEATGKQTVLGLYPDSIIVLGKTQTPDNEKQKLPEIIERLAILINVSELSDGEHEYKAQFIDPLGNQSGDKIDLGKMSVEQGKSATIVLEAKPFMLHGRGTYKFNLFIDNAVYSFPFAIIDGSLA